MENTTLPREAQEMWSKRGREDFKSQKNRTSVAVRQSALRGKGVGRRGIWEELGAGRG